MTYTLKRVVCVYIFGFVCVFCFVLCVMSVFVFVYLLCDMYDVHACCVCMCVRVRVVCLSFV